MNKSIYQYVVYIYCCTVGFHFHGVRRTASCDGTYRCINTKCPYLLSYKKENKKNLSRNQRQMLSVVVVAIVL